jgi:uncharacterized protein YukE
MLPEQGNNNAPIQLAEKLAKTTAPVFGLFNRRQFEIAATRKLSQSDFYTSYHSLFIFGLCLAFVAQAASLISEYGYFEAVLSVKLTGLPLLIAASFAVILLEGAKYFVMNRVFADLFRLAGVRVSYGLAVIALALSALSVWASIQGGGNLAVNPQAITDAANPYEQEISTIRQEIADIKQRNTWKGKTWIAGAEKKLLHQKEEQLAAVIAGKEKATNEAQSKEAANIKTYQYAFSGFELLFVICTLWAWYFRRRVAVEAEIHYLKRETTGGTEPKPFYETATPKATPRSIGFTFGWQNPKNTANENRLNENRLNEGTRICKQCGTAYHHRHHKQLYCSDSCRIAAWELRTGKKFTPKTGKKQLDLF